MVCKSAPKAASKEEILGMNACLSRMLSIVGYWKGPGLKSEALGGLYCSHSLKYVSGMTENSNMMVVSKHAPRSAR